MSFQPPPTKKSNTGLWLGGAAILLVALIAALVLLLNRQPVPVAPATAVIVSAETATVAPATATPITVNTPTSASTEAPTSTPMPELGTSNLFIEYILDASGSMSETLSDGSPKIEVAQRVLTEHMRSFRPETNIGLRVYGHRLPYQQTDESCQDIELIAPPEKGQMERIAGWLQDFTVQGMTPLAASLELAKDDFIYDASRINSIVMLSDGIETCGGDPCQLVEDLKAEGINFTIHVIGLDVDDPTRQQLSCIAEAGGGTYHDARSQQELNRALDAVQADVTRDEVIVPPDVDTPTPEVATPTLLPAANAPVLAPLDRADRASVLEWLFYALREGDLAIFDALVNDEGIAYINYIEGGQPVAKAHYLTDLAQRFPSEPRCDGYGEVAADRLQVWTSGWNPAWRMTEMCYGGCQPIDPPWESDIAAFFLEKVNGQWAIDAMWLNEIGIWQDVYGVSLRACLEGSANVPTPGPIQPVTEAAVPTNEISAGQILFFSN